MDDVQDLYHAAENNDIAEVRRLLDEGVKPVKRLNRDPLWIAVKKRNVEIVELLLEAGADPNVTNGDGISLLYYAVRFVDVEIIRLLLAAKANPNISRVFF